LDRGIVIEKTADSKPLKIIGTHTDITKIKEAETLFEEQRSFYESILNNIPTDIAVFSANHHYLFINPVAIKDPVLRKWMIGKKDEDYCAYRNKPIQIAEERRKLFYEVVASKELRFWEEELVQPNGNVEYHLRHMFPVLNEKKEVILVIGYGINITERIKAEKDLKIAKETTEKASKAKEIFLANMSHEIRTPMNGILGIGALLYKTKQNSKQSEYTKLILESANNLLHIVNDVLDFAKIESGKFDLEHIPFDLADKILAALQTFVFKAEEKGLLLEFDNQLKKERIVIGDPFRLGQVLNNLINNAIKFTSKGSIVIIASENEIIKGKTFFEFRVKDSGIGIEEDQLALIFQEFIQASSDTSRKFGGTGLGLSISKNLVEMQGGSIKVESKLGKGTTFIVNIPYEVGNSEMLEQKNSSDYEFGGLEQKKILVAEDVMINQIIVKQMLEDQGHLITLVGNGEEAVDSIIQNDYDLVFMDIHMPKLDGYEATKRIRELPNSVKRNIPIVALTANAFKNDTDLFEEAGFNGFVTKPFTEQNLFDSIYKYLNLTVQIKDEHKKTNSTLVNNPDKLYDLTSLQGIDPNDTGFIKEIISLFLNNSTTDLEDLKQAVAEENMYEVFQLAHKMKSSIYSMGIVSLYKPLESMEAFAKTKDQTEKIPSVFLKLEKTLLQVFEQLRKDFY
jgi:signal transduction histidine kinase/DNA-binding NarL/FixJ family response regulator